MGSGQLSSVPLPRSFFDRPSHEVAPDLLGRVLVHGPVAVRLTEVEAYGGPGEDPAAHTYRGRTPRNAVMFGPPGHLYVYFTYGMHFCTNLVCLPEGHGSAVLLRAGEVVAGLDEARARRSGGARAVTDRDLARGPARLAVVLGLLREHNGLDAIAEAAPPLSDAAPPLSDAAPLLPGAAAEPFAPGLSSDQAALRALDHADEPGCGAGCEPGCEHGFDQAAGHRLTGVPHGAAAVLVGRPADPDSIRSGPRTGISTAKDTPWRFWIDGDPTVSPYRPHVPRRRNAAATSVGGAPRS